MHVNEFRQCFQAGDADGALAHFAPEFAFYHTAHADATTDLKRLRPLLAVAREALGEHFRFTDHLVGDTYHALPWTARINDVHADGVDLLKLDDQGRIAEFRISMRPIHAIEEWNRAMVLRSGRPTPHHSHGSAEG